MRCGQRSASVADSDVGHENDSYCVGTKPPSISASQPCLDGSSSAQPVPPCGSQNFTVPVRRPVPYRVHSGHFQGCPTPSRLGAPFRMTPGVDEVKLVRGNLWNLSHPCCALVLQPAFLPLVVARCHRSIPLMLCLCGVYYGHTHPLQAPSCLVCMFTQLLLRGFDAASVALEKIVRMDA